MIRTLGTLILWCLWMNISAQSFEVYQGDTINRTDARGVKQGSWKLFDATKKTVRAEGRYVNDKKEGVWKKYYANGKTQSEITYINSRTNGYAKLYYEDGTVSEEGTWKGDKWVGKYKYYHKNGNIAHDWVYNDNGVRTGVQFYYHENGKLMIEGEWKEGKKSGLVKEYYSDGSLRFEELFINGVLDETRSKSYQPNTRILADQRTQIDDHNISNPDMFEENGYHKLFNKKKQVEQEGTFLNGRLMDGKRYIYDEKSGKLIRTYIYKEGKRTQVIE
jgi:antitoxin component YwqK of YwqJK toxin-antitoxin module